MTIVQQFVFCRTFWYIRKCEVLKIWIAFFQSASAYFTGFSSDLSVSAFLIFSFILSFILSETSKPFVTSYKASFIFFSNLSMTISFFFTQITQPDVYNKSEPIKTGIQVSQLRLKSKWHTVSRNLPLQYAESWNYKADTGNYSAYPFAE